ncbi:choice-of-anchor Q domain-containing protein [Luteolibacter soli]|uniref:Choice-of-anchor Q domain-containing protein n=1 Tax=Luteolibacter soli TaxID=3135280 RepID=A0ABU9AU24_9BACT
MTKSLRTLFATAALIAALLCQSRAADLTVTTLSDDLDAPAGATLSLREAIRDAVAGDTVKFAPALNGGTILLSRGTLTLSKNVTIDAMSLASGVVIDGNLTQRVFSTPSIVVMRGLHVTRGRNGIQNTGNLTMEDCTVSACVSSNSGAGILASGTVTLKQCSILSNRMEGGSGGGGISVSSGITKLINCTVADNEALTAGAVSFSSLTTVDLIHCTVLNNRSTSFPGGGVSVSGSGGTLRLQNSVISGNTTTSSGRIDLYVDGVNFQKSGQNFISCNNRVTTQFPAGTLVGTTAAPLDPLLGALAVNGGRTSSCLPLSGSKLLQAAVATADSPSIDQRGLPRVSGTAADLGSVEASASSFFPSDGTTNAAVAPVLEWSHQLSASQYQVYLGTAPGTLALQSTTSTGRMALPMLDVGATYYWRIDSIVSGSTIPGPLLSFVVRQPLVVTKAADELSSTFPEEGVSLREAITLANSNPGLDIIRFHPDLTGIPVTVTRGSLTISSDLIIEGDSLPGGASVVGACLRIGAPTELRALALMNGGASSFSGGAINITSTLTARNCTISGNRAGNGGGIYLQSGSCNLIHCTITGNTANLRGGGIYRSAGTLTLENSIIAGNRALEGSPDVRVTASLTYLGRNLIGDNSGSETMFPATSWVGTASSPLNAGLAPAGTYVAGKSQHCPPVPSSPSLAQALTLSTTPAADQLGRPRPLDGTAALGAVERDPALVFSVPAAGASEVALAPLLAWNASGQSFEIFIGTSSDSLTSVGTSTRGSFQLPTLTAGTSYYWRVDATISGVTTTGTVSSFTTRTAIVVTTLADENDLDPPSGAGLSLREALGIAAARPGPDRIVFAAALSGATISLSQATGLNVSSECEIDGSDLPGGLTLNLAGNRQLRIAVEGEATIRRLKFTGASTINLSGGALGCDGAATLSGCTFHGNSSAGGAALYNNGGRLVVENSIFTGNAATSNGGALYHTSGITRATNCTFTENRAAQGGAIYCAGTCELTHCTITNNLSQDAGGLYVGLSGTVLTNSIVAGNKTNNTNRRSDVFASSASYLTPQGANLIGVNTGAETLFPSGTLVGTASAPLDPKLLLLATESNPGAMTVPAYGSPALNHGMVLASLPAADQRGLPRIAGALPDLGAIEVSASDAFFYPANATTGVLPSETLRWNFEGGADSYLILIGAAGGPLTEIGSTSSDSFAVSLESSTSYQWQVIAVRGEVHIPSPVMAFTTRSRFTVTTLADEDDANPTDGSGLSLRECLHLAASNPGRDQISISPSILSGPLLLSKGALNLDSDVEIDGSIPDGRFVIDGNDQTRLLECDDWYASVSLSNLVLQKGYASNNGGGITNSAWMSLRRVELRNCSSGYEGGAIENDDGVVEMDSCSILANRAAMDGNAVYSFGIFRARNSTFAYNHSALSEGGTTSSSTIWAEDLEMTNCTVASNRGRRAAIDIFVRGDLTHTTVSGNQANNSAAGIEWSGPLYLRNCIVAGNHTGSPQVVASNWVWKNDDLLGDTAGLHVEGTNLIGNNYLLETVLPAGPLIGTPANPLDPRLLDLGDHGGATFTMPPGGASPARRASASLANPPSADQRGVQRTSGIAPDLGSADHSSLEAALFPVGNEAGVPVKPRLTWIFEPAATSYEVFLGTSPAAMTSIGTVTSPWIEPTGLLPLATYHWKVVANVSASAIHSSTQSFTTRDFIRVTSAGDSLSGGMSPLTLRQAVDEAELNPGYDEVRLGSGLPAEGITLAGATIELSGALAIRAEGRLFPIGGNSQSGVFYAWTGSNFRLENLAIHHGRRDSGGAGVTIARASGTLVGCELNANTAMTNIGWGGAVRIAGGDLTADSCLFQGNHADGYGGALHLEGHASLANCTFSGNSAKEGGAIQGSATIELDHCTLAYNQATDRGGCSNLDEWDQIRIANCLVAGNQVTGTTFATPGHDFYFTGAANSTRYPRQGVNFVGNNNSCAALFPAGPKVGTTSAPLNPGLAPLGNYGGMTRCHIPLPGSPVIDAATLLVTSPGSDQRKLPRPIGSAPDIGAVESFPVNSPLVDSDLDGMDDRLEVMWGFSVGPNEGSADADGDGVTNADELDSFTNPFDAADRLKILTSPFTTPPANGGAAVMGLTWTSFPGVHYTVEISSDLDFGAGDLREIDAGTATGFTRSSLVPLQPGRDFVRVRAD